MSLAQTVVSAVRGKRRPRGTLRVVDHSSRNRLHITYNIIEELVRTDENGHIVPAAMRKYR